MVQCPHSRGIYVLLLKSSSVIRACVEKADEKYLKVVRALNDNNICTLTVCVRSLRRQVPQLGRPKNVVYAEAVP